MVGFGFGLGLGLEVVLGFGIEFGTEGDCDTGIEPEVARDRFILAMAMAPMGAIPIGLPIPMPPI